MSKLGESITQQYGVLGYAEWSRDTDYQQYQRVQHNGLVYAARSASTGISPETDSDVWELLGSMPLEQGDGRDTVVFTDSDKKQTLSGKSINGGKGISVDKNQVSNTVNANVDDSTVKVDSKTNKLYVPTATAGTLGVVRAGTGISIDDEGTISANIPVADEHRIGSKEGISPFFITEESGGTVITGNSIVGGANTSVEQKSAYTYAVDVPEGSATTKGVLKVGSGINVSSGTISVTPYTLPTASATTLGGIKVGKNLSMTDGVLSANDPYSLPTASADTLGGIKVGDGLSIADGVLSASGGSGSGWETVNKTVSADLFNVNCYKNSSFILVNMWSKKEATYNTTFYINFDFSNPFLINNVELGNLQYVYPIIGGRNMDYSSTTNVIRGNAKNVNNKFKFEVDVRNYSFYPSQIISFLIPYIEI